MPNVRRRRLPLVCLDFVAIIRVLALSMSSNFQVFSKVNAFRSHRRIRIPAWAKAILVKMFIAMNKNKTCKSIWKLLSNEFKYMLYRNVLMPVFAPNAVCLDAIRWVVFFSSSPLHIPSYGMNTHKIVTRGGKSKQNFNIVRFSVRSIHTYVHSMLNHLWLRQCIQPFRN